MIDRPIPFKGSQEERIANRQTHYWGLISFADIDEVRCLDCDCKPWHVAADYPCGEEPPREVVDEDGDEYIARRIAEHETYLASEAADHLFENGRGE